MVVNLVPEKSCGFSDRSLGCGLARTLDCPPSLHPGRAHIFPCEWLGIGGGDVDGIFPEPD